MAEMQTIDKTLKKYISNSVKDKKGKFWIIKDQCLFYVKTNKKSKKKSLQLMVPKYLKEQVMKAHHDNLLSNHCGYVKTMSKITQWY